MNEWIELTDYSNNELILIRKSAVASVSKSDSGIVCVYIGDGDNYYSVNESYDEIKNMLVRPDMIEIKYSDDDQERIEKWIGELQRLPLTVVGGTKEI